MERILKEKIKETLKVLYNCDISNDNIQIQETRKDFKGDFTLVVFPLLRYSKNTPEKTGEMIGNHIAASFPAVSGDTLNSIVIEAIMELKSRMATLGKTPTGGCKMSPPRSAFTI